MVLLLSRCRRPALIQNQNPRKVEPTLGEFTNRFSSSSAGVGVTSLREEDLSWRRA